MATFGSDQLTRIITNLYSKSFEEGTANKFNLLVTRAYTPAVTDVDPDAIWKATAASLYEIAVLLDKPAWYMPCDDDRATSYGGEHSSGSGIGFTDNGIYDLNVLYVPNSASWTNDYTPGVVGSWAQFFRQVGTINGSGGLHGTQYNVAPANAFGASLIPNDPYGGSIQFTQTSTANNASRDVMAQSGGSYLTLGSNWPTASITFECLVKVPVSNANRAFIFGYNDAGTDTVYLSIGMNNHLLEFSSSADSVRLTKGSTVLDDGLVHHICITRGDQGLITWYVDGVSQGTQAGTAGAGETGLPTGANLPFYAGIVWPQTATIKMYPFSGSVQHLAVYPYELTSAQVVAHYAAIGAQASQTTLDKAPAVQRTIAPAARYYAPLTVGGADQSKEASAYGFAAGVTVTYTPNICNPTQMWGVVRLRPTWAFGSPPTTPTIWRWATDANNRLILQFTGGNWQVNRLSGGVGGAATVAGSHAARADITLGFYFDATHTAVSLNGANWVTAANTAIPTAPTPNFDIGNGDNPSNSYVHWMVMGLGTISNADIAAMHAWGNIDPNWWDFPQGSMLALDPCFNWWGIDSDHLPTGVWGSGFYA